MIFKTFVLPNQMLSTVAETIKMSHLTLSEDSTKEKKKKSKEKEETRKRVKRTLSLFACVVNPRPTAFSASSSREAPPC
jgi:hypothetical protein